MRNQDKPLLCVHKGCKTLQSFDGEYWDKHYPTPRVKYTEHDIYMDYLNVIDEFASEAVRDNDNGEAQKLSTAYTMVANFIDKYAKR